MLSTLPRQAAHEATAYGGTLTTVPSISLCRACSSQADQDNATVSNASPCPRRLAHLHIPVYHQCTASAAAFTHTAPLKPTTHYIQDSMKTSHHAKEAQSSSVPVNAIVYYSNMVHDRAIQQTPTQQQKRETATPHRSPSRHRPDIWNLPLWPVL